MGKTRKRRKNVILLLIIGIIIAGGISIGLHFFKRDMAEAISVEDTLDIIGENSPVNTLLIAKIQELEEIEAKKIQERERERIIKEKRLEEIRKAGGKIAYLTFDDGPSTKVTPMVLDILKEYDIKATFFVVGKMAERNPEILKRISEEGHIIGNHTYSHDYGYIYKSSANLLKDIDKADKVLKSILGEDFHTDLFRFPGGSFGKYKAFLRKAVIDAGYRHYDWNALNGDAEGLNRTTTQLINRLKETTKNKKNVIILMHDTDAKMTTAQSLRDILDYLIAEGYYFDVLD